MKKACLFLLLALTAALAGASTVGEVEYTCPVCGKVFKATLQMSGSEFGRNLDLKSTGAIICPWPIPQCPDCRFAFTEDTFTAEETEALKTWVLSADFKKIKFPDVQYYCLAQELIFLKKDPVKIAFIFLSAVWESGDRAIILEAITWFEKIPQTDESWFTAQMLLIEFHRRAALFDKAMEYCARVKKLPDCKDYLLTVVTYQERLITARDTAEHPLPEE